VLRQNHPVQWNRNSLYEGLANQRTYISISIIGIIDAGDPKMIMKVGLESSFNQRMEKQSS